MSEIETPGRVLMMHAQFEADRPDEAAAEERYEQNRQATYLAAHGSLDGYRSRREFPCAGALRIIDETEHFHVAACDACPYLTTFRRDEMTKDAW